MRKCPNCSRPTKRTEDWACQWCGYPLVSKAYKKIPKTYSQLKEERLQEQRKKARFKEDAATVVEGIVKTVVDSGAARIELTVEEIYSVCTSDKVAAAAKFKDRTLAITGMVASTVIDYDGDIYYVSLTSEQKKEGCNVNCMFDRKNSSELNKLTEGQKVTVEGKYDDYELNILLKDCALARLPEPEPVTEPEPEVIPGPEARPEAELPPEPEAVTEAEPEVVSEPEARPEAELPPEAEAVVEAELEVAPETEPVTEAEPEVIPELETRPEAELPPEPEAVTEAESEVVTEPEAVAEPELEVTVDELLAAYAADEAAASAKFNNKRLQLTGIVNRIEIQEYLEFHYINITNSENNLLEHIRCFFDKKHEPELSQLVRGQKVVVQGTFEGSIVSMFLRDCILVS